jgi:glycosyltransferase involved in cell wall biosynthesis
MASDTTTLAFHIFDMRMGGAQGNTARLVNALSERGWKVDLVLSAAEGPLLDEVSPRVNVIALDGPRPARTARALPRWCRETATIAALARYVRARRPAILFAAANHVHFSTIIAHGLAGGPGHVALRVTNAIRRNGARWPYRPIYTLAARTLFPRAAAAIAVSDGLKGDMIAACGLPAARVRMIPEPVIAPDFQRRMAVPVDHPWFRDTTVPVLVGAGRMVPQKDFTTLLRAFAMASGARPMRLALFGDGPERPALERLAAELGVAARVYFAGFTDALPAYLRQARLFVLSSRWEGLGSVIVEALAAGCPVASTDCPSGPAEILDGGRLGSLAPCGDPRALAAVILAELTRVRAKADLIARARRYGQEQVCRDYERLIAELLPTASTQRQSAA